MATLYELTDNYQHVLEIAEQLDEETLKDTLDSLDDAIDSKAENSAKVIRELEGNINTLAAEIQRLNERKTALNNNVKYLKEYLQNEMEKVGKTKIKGELFNVGIQNNPASVYVAD
ncbi:MAG: siphovirus Gp157 family protein, partial [Tetragenococcus halophilus]|nr:siphovirus Gp157 family protein [Tetragenococcus halophilus]